MSVCLFLEQTDLEPIFSFTINMWNGVYYVLEPDEDGRLVGRLHEMNMDILAVPPDEGDLRPIQPKHLEPGEPESHWLSRLVVE